MSDIQRALRELASGRPILIYDADGREEETDIVFASEHVKSDDVRFLRKQGGGLICATVIGSIAETLGLPFLVDVFRQAEPQYPLLRRSLPEHLPYDTKSAFSITVNHRRCYTGITDNDRALTISEFGKLVGEVNENPEPENAPDIFTEKFRIPGHVHLLRTSKELLKDRKGHTELSTAMCIMAGLAPSAAICEMMGDNGNALSRDLAGRFAESNGLMFLSGEQIIEGWEIWCE
jgi:3,4-dihydroxy 2-butanone 4-phosphate synthase